MHADEFKTALSRQPFKPFRIRLGSGSTIDITHPEWVLVSPSGRTAHIYESTSPDGDVGHIIDVMLIESIEILPNRRNGKNGHGPNGSRKKK